jgi:serine/threonine protein phosphatase PrpC
MREDRHIVGRRWRIIGDSVVGSSHRKTSSPCQDANRWSIIARGSGEVALAVLADGAGSARWSRQGAAIATRTVLRVLKPCIIDSENAAFDANVLRAAIETARETLVRAAEKRRRCVSEYACTLLILVAMPDATFAAHIGDGAIVAENEDSLEVLSWPMQGEYANVTSFLTAHDVLENARIIDTRRVERFALFSDGMQHLALDYGERCAFKPFFEPMFAAVADRTYERAHLQSALRSYLDSPTVNERTDDDKTLLLGARLHG